MGNTVMVFTQPSCTMCTATKRSMDKYGVEYVEAELADFPAVVAAAREKGITAAPVVTYGDMMWGGFNLDKIRELRDVRAEAA